MKKTIVLTETNENGDSDTAIFELTDRFYKVSGSVRYQSPRPVYECIKGRLKGWLCYKHPDGQLVTLEKIKKEGEVIIEDPLNENQAKEVIKSFFNNIS